MGTWHLSRSNQNNYKQAYIFVNLKDGKLVSQSYHIATALMHLLLLVLDITVLLLCDILEHIGYFMVEAVFSASCVSLFQTWRAFEPSVR